MRCRDKKWKYSAPLFSIGSRNRFVVNPSKHPTGESAINHSKNNAYQQI
jgi:hypothetical protein